MARQSRALLVDDQPNDVNLLTHAMWAEGVYVVNAKSFVEGKRLALEGKWDLIICDRRLNGDSGYDFGKWAMEQWQLKEVPKVMLTGFTLRRGDQILAIEAGFLGCISKSADAQNMATELISFMKP